jgi:HK97 family phage prohead protease/HK97 family phage major capsid protein
MSKKMYNAQLVSKIKSVHLDDDGEDLIIEGYANTVTKDRAGDVIPMEAWMTKNALTNYLKNPIVLAYHNHSMPIGAMIGHEVTEIGLKIKARISKGAGDVYHLIKDGILTTFSVGFGILDAEYDQKSDTYYITDVELHEVSVVSVPCNQDSVFSVAKSMNSQDFEKFKNNITPSGDIKDKNIMTLEQMQAQLAEMQKNSVSPEAIAKAAAQAATSAIEAATSKKLAEDAATLVAEKAAADQTASVKTAARLEAETLVKELKAELSAKDGTFAEMVKANNDQIVSLKEEIAQVVASRSNAVSAVATAVRGGDAQRAKNVDSMVMLGIIKGVDGALTSFGKKFTATEKSVNGSSSIAVSSDGYETEFSTNLMRDIQAKLVVAPLFTELSMNSANMTIPINPARSNANWISAANMADGTASARTGAEITVTITEKTLKTFKLAAKTFLTEETEEDAIISVIPLLRSHLVESHAAEMDASFLIGDGTAKPKGLATQAMAVAAGAQTSVSTAKADGTVKVTAADLLAARRKMGLYGIDIKDISLIVSQDAYWDLLEDAEWADVQQVATASTKLVGEVGNVYGMKVLVSDEFAAKAVSTAYAVMVNTSNFVVTRQRGVTLRSDFDIELDRTVFVATQRVNLEPLIEASAGNGKGVVAVTYAAS